MPVMDYREQCHNIASAEAVLQQFQKVLIVGLSPNPKRVSNQTARYLASQNFEVTGVNPLLDHVESFRCYRALREVPDPLEIVAFVQSAESIGPQLDHVIARHPKLIWVEQGCPEESLHTARLKGILVVTDSSLMNEVHYIQEKTEQISQCLGYG